MAPKVAAVASPVKGKVVKAKGISTIVKASTSAMASHVARSSGTVPCLAHSSFMSSLMSVYSSSSSISAWVTALASRRHDVGTWAAPAAIARDVNERHPRA